MNRKPWSKRSTKVLDQTPFVKYRRDIFVLPDGSDGIYTYLDKNPCVGVIPITDDGKFVLVSNFRYLYQEPSWEFPMGHAPKGKNLLFEARKELIEEAGYDAKKFRALPRFYNSPGCVRQVVAVYVARGLFQSRKYAPDKREAILGTKIVTKKAFEAMVKKGVIRDSITLAAYSLYRSLSV